MCEASLRKALLLLKDLHYEPQLYNGKIWFHGRPSRWPVELAACHDTWSDCNRVLSAAGVPRRSLGGDGRSGLNEEQGRGL